MNAAKLKKVNTTGYVGGLLAWVFSSVLTFGEGSVLYDVSQVGWQAEVGELLIVQVAGGGAAGSGNLHPFVRLKASPSEQGYNTSGVNEFDEVGGVAFPDIQLGQLPLVFLNGRAYRQIVLDSNEPGGAESTLSLNRFQVFVSSTTGNTDYALSPSSLGDLVYDMDATEDASILLSDLNSGSGDIDYTVFFPESFFDGYDDQMYVYVYSQFGYCDPTSGGFEEWAFGDYSFIPSSLDLIVQKDDGDGDAETFAVEAGDAFTYTVNISNSIPADTGYILEANEVYLYDTLPESVTFLSDSMNACAPSNGLLRCGPFDLVGGADVTIELEVSYAGTDSVDVLTNHVWVTALEFDANLDNNEDFEPTLIRRCPITMNCPPDTTLSCGDGMTPEETGSPAVSNPCEKPAELTFSDELLQESCPQIWARHWMLTDVDENQIMCDQLITIQEEPLLISCPQDQTIHCDSSTDPNTLGRPTVPAICGESPLVTYADESVSGDCVGSSEVFRTWTAIDSCLNQTQCVQRITIVDTTPPTVTCPPDVTVECDASTETSETGIATGADLCDQEVSITFSDVSAPGSCSAERVITRAWTATDDCGNSTACDQVLTIVDTTPPTITCPENLTLECDASTSPSETGVATASDNCDHDVAVTFTDNSTPGSCPAERIITRTWTATDDCGNSASCDQLLTIVDTTPPTITCPENLTLECDASTSPSETGVAMASDNCDQDVAVTFTDNSTPGSCPAERIITRTWTATDDCGNSASCDQLLTIVDTTPPTITCPENLTLECDASTSPSETGVAMASDNCDQDVAVAFTDSSTPGSCLAEQLITRTWTATDDCGNRASCDQVLTIVDTTPPTITCPENLTLECDASTSTSETGTATASDNCDQDVAVTFTDNSTPGSCPAERIITRTWTATDDCGNSASCDQLLTIVDTTPPTITCPENLTLECDASTSPSETGVAMASDNCDQDVAVAFTDSSTPGSCLAEQLITRTWTATDDCGNRASCDQVLTIVDTTPPTITCPENLTLECDASTSPSETGVAMASDNCDQDVAVAFTDSSTPGSCLAEQLITRTWTATDDCGNRASCDQVLTMVDTTPPTITCPENLTLECDASTQSSETGVATASDNCDQDVAVTFADNSSPGSCPAERIITRTWAATDDCGNAASCDQVLTIVDTTPPTITCPENLTLECDASTSPSETGVARPSDNCDQNVAVTFADNSSPGSCPAERIITRTWTATDDCGNRASCDQVLTIVDTTPPAISCPENLTLECDASTSPSETGVATASDNCDQDVAVTVADSSTPGSCPAEQLITRTWTATDDCGNRASCDQVLTIVDTTPPNLLCPPDLILHCVSPQYPDQTGWAQVDDICDPAPSITYNDSINVAVQCPQLAIITRLWIATDRCGNQAQCEQLLTVEDREGPVITCPPDITVGCDESTEPEHTNVATAEDNCSAEVAIRYVDESLPGKCPILEQIVRTWTATDDCGNSSSCVQVISRIDATPPQLFCPEAVFVDSDSDCMATVPLIEMEASDNCSAVVTVVQRPPAGAILQGPIDTTIEVIVSDDCGNETRCTVDIQVRCVAAIDVVKTVYREQDAGASCPGGPLVVGTNATPITYCFKVKNMGNVFLTDISLEDFILEINTDDFVRLSGATAPASLLKANGPTSETLAPGAELEFMYESRITRDLFGAARVEGTPSNSKGEPILGMNRVFAENAAGEVKIIFPEVNLLVDVDAFACVCPNETFSLELDVANTGNDPISNAGLSSPFCTLGMIGGDSDGNGLLDTNEVWRFSCDMSLASSVLMPLQFSGKNSVGGDVSQSFELPVSIDVSSPEITCPADTTIECGSDTSPDALGIPDVQDACELGSVTFLDELIPEECGDRIERHWRALDQCGSWSECVQYIQVIDVSPPIILECPSEVLYRSIVPDLRPLITAIDLCSDVVIRQTPAPGTPAPYDHILLEVVDACGLTAECEVSLIKGAVHGVVWFDVDGDLTVDEDLTQHGINDDLIILEHNQIMFTQQMTRITNSVWIEGTYREVAFGYYRMTGLPLEHYFIYHDEGYLEAGMIHTSYANMDFELTAGIPEIEVNFGITRIPLFVALSVLRATSEEGGLRVEWVTGVEYQSLGFYLERLDRVTGRRSVVGDFIPSVGGGTETSYMVMDAGANKDDSAGYILTEIDWNLEPTEYRLDFE